jgi:hypothetical protein
MTVEGLERRNKVIKITMKVFGVLQPSGQMHKQTAVPLFAKLSVQVIGGFLGCYEKIPKTPRECPLLANEALHNDADAPHVSGLI